MCWNNASVLSSNTFWTKINGVLRSPFKMRSPQSQTTGLNPRLASFEARSVWSFWPYWLPSGAASLRFQLSPYKAVFVQPQWLQGLPGTAGCLGDVFLSSSLREVTPAAAPDRCPQQASAVTKLLLQARRRRSWSGRTGRHQWKWSRGGGRILCWKVSVGNRRKSEFPAAHGNSSEGKVKGHLNRRAS